MKKISSKILWITAACSGMLVLNHCTTNDSFQPDKNVSRSELPPPPPPPGKADVGKPDSSKLYTVVEQMPSFSGGEDSLMRYLSDHVEYPAEAKAKHISGTVVVQFIVGTDGNIRNVTTVGPYKGGGLETEAIAVVKGMPEWIPGRQDGKAVAVQYNLPIRFVFK